MAPPRLTVCQYGHDRWYIGKNGDRQCAECAKNRKSEQRLCVRGHDDWAYRSGNRKRYCRTCERDRDAERRRKQRPLQAKCWSEWSRIGDRGPRDETFTYEEIMRARESVA